jgi:hypothetical protein
MFFTTAVWVAMFLLAQAMLAAFWAFSRAQLAAGRFEELNSLTNWVYERGFYGLLAFLALLAVELAVYVVAFTLRQRAIKAAVARVRGAEESPQGPATQA